MTRLLSAPSSSPKNKSDARRVPRQERSQHTVDAILAATRKLVIRDGLAKLSTNRVARLAGVSIGSLYQYFPSKRALLSELRARHQAAGERTFLAEFSALIRADVPTAVRHFVTKVLEVHREDPELHQALESEVRPAWVGDWERRALLILRAYIEQHRHEVQIADLDQAAFIVGLTVHSLVHGIVIERPQLLDDPTLVDGVVRMLLAYLKVHPKQDPP